MSGSWLTALRNYVPGFRRLERVPRQLMGRSPFAGDICPHRVPLMQFGSGNQRCRFRISGITINRFGFSKPTSGTPILKADRENITVISKFLDCTGSRDRDPRVIRAITTETGDREGQFDRDTLPSTGIARATGKDTLLYSNGSTWRTQKKLAASPFGKVTLFQPEQFHEFAETFRHTVRKRLNVLERYLESNAGPVQVQLEPEIKVVMLEMLANNFFGAEISVDDIRDRYVPALER